MHGACSARGWRWARTEISCRAPTTSSCPCAVFSGFLSLPRRCSRNPGLWTPPAGTIWLGSMPTSLFCALTGWLFSRTGLFSVRAVLLCMRTRTYCMRAGVFRTRADTMFLRAGLFCMPVGVFGTQSDLFYMCPGLYCTRGGLFCLRADLFGICTNGLVCAYNSCTRAHVCFACAQACSACSYSRLAWCARMLVLYESGRKYRGFLVSIFVPLRSLCIRTEWYVRRFVVSAGLFCMRVGSFSMLRAGLFDACAQFCFVPARVLCVRVQMTHGRKVMDQWVG